MIASEAPIKDFALGIYDGPHATPPECSEGAVFLGIKNFSPEGHLDFSDVRFVSEADLPKWTRRVVPQEGDVVFTYEATLHRYALIPSGFRGCLGRRVALVRPDPTKLDHRFLYYYFRSPAWRVVIESNVITGATVDRIPIERFPSFPLRAPSLPEQSNIAAILASYDELIENNRRRMVLLEEAARKLYREWFIRLRFPGHEHTPVRDGLPEGWERRSLEEVAEFRLGKMLDEKKNKGDLMPYLANVNVRWGEFDLSNLREMRFQDHERESYGLKAGDIVMCEGGEPGRCAIWMEQLPSMMIQKAIHRIRCRDGFDPFFLYRYLRHLGQSGHLAQLFTGATIKHLPREKLAKVSVVVPPLGLLRMFSEKVGPLEDQRKVLQALNDRASKARDRLLPKLMSGEISV